MIRKAPIRTYHKKKTAQSSFSYSQPTLWESRCFGKITTTNEKNNKPTLPEDKKDNEELSSGYFDTTFDRMAKTARLPPPPQQESHSFIDISSEVTSNEPSAIVKDVCDLPLKESPKIKNSKRSRRNHNHRENEMILKKRLKHDLINISTKKIKTVRSSKKKVSANNKTAKNVTDSKKILEIHVQKSLSMNKSKDWFFTQSVDNYKVAENKKVQKNRYLLRRRKNVKKILNSSSSDSGSNQESDNYILSVKTKLKKNVTNRRNAKMEIPKVCNSIGISSNESSDILKFQARDEGDEKNCSVENLQKGENKENIAEEFYCPVNISRLSIVSYRTRSKARIKDSPALEYVKNFRRYSALNSGEDEDLDPVDSKKYNRILTRKQYIKKAWSKLTRKNDDQKSANASDNLKNILNISQSKKDLEIKPCSVVLQKYNEKKNPILSRKESTVVPQFSNAHSSVDIFQSNISMANLSIKPESHDPLKMRLHESGETQQTQFIKNQSNLVYNVDMGIKPCTVTITDHNAKKIVARTKRCNPNWSLHYLKCSTPISTYVNKSIIDRSINHLSPITVGNDTYQKTRKSIDEEETQEPSVINCIVNSNNSSKECSDVPKTNMRWKSARKRLSISYDEDKSLEMSDEYCERKRTEKIAIENVANTKDSAHNVNSGKIQSPTSQIQKSLENLKLNLENSNNKYDADNKDKLKLSQKEIVTISTGSDRSSIIFENMTTEFTGQSKDTCSQLTPIGIITTRSGRQLKLSMTTQKKFFDDSADSKILPDASKIVDESDSNHDCEIIDDSETTKNRMLKNRINKHRGTRFADSKSHFTRNNSRHVKSSRSRDMCTAHEMDCFKIEPAIDTSKLQASNDSSSPEATNVNASRKFTTISSDNSSKDSMEDCKNDCKINDSTSVVDDERSSTSASCAADPKSEHARLSDQEILRSMLSVNNSENSASEWSTISNSENDDCTTSNVQDKTKKESYEKDRLSNLSLCLSKSLLTSNQNELGSNLSSKTLNDMLESAYIPSPDVSEMPLIGRIESLSSQINTRKRRKTFKPITESVSQVSENQTAIETSDLSKSVESFDSGSRNTSDLKDNMKTENVPNSVLEQKDSDLFKKPFDVNLKINLQPRVLLQKLKDSVRINVNQKQGQDVELTAIPETSNENLQTITKNSNESFTSNDSKLEKDLKHFEGLDHFNSPLEGSEIGNSSFKGNTTAASDSDCAVAISYVSEPEITERQSVFLKPGKEWARSLSILNNIQNGLDLELLSARKGKNWRKSVQTILGMQQERVIQSCLGKNEDDKDAQPRFRALNCTSIPDTTPCSEEQSIGSASPSRFTRRMSIRVVPENKRLSHIEDTSFLEAYGITASKSRKTLSRRSNLKCRKALIYNVQCEDAAIEPVETEHIATARDVVLQRCCQEDYLSFIECFPAEYLANCRKIGEGVYGEVFLFEQEKQKSVIKIIPIEGETLVNGERQKRFDEILSEIVIAKELHNLRYGEKYQTHGFAEVKNIKCISGKYPEELIELWKAYDDDKGSDNDCPSMFDENQLYIALELGHGGQDLEAFVFQSAVEAHALFVQAALALAVAEQSLEFEHRDLHWGNVLISHTKESRVVYKLNNKEYSYPTKGMQVAIIDFTLSRMSYEGCCIFNDLALDPALFTAQGEYQFDIYRLMREKIGNNWQKFEPYTNILWLHYTLDKMITALRYKRKSTKVHREAIFRLQELKDVVLNYESAFDFVTNCEKITSLQRKTTTRTTVKSTQIESDDQDVQT